MGIEFTLPTHLGHKYSVHLDVRNQLSGATPSVFLIRVQLASSVLIFFLSRLSLSSLSLFPSLCISVYVLCTHAHTHISYIHTSTKDADVGGSGYGGPGGCGWGVIGLGRRLWEDWDRSGKSRQPVSKRQ